MIDVVRARAEGWSDDEIVRAIIELEGVSEKEARRRLEHDTVIDDVVSVDPPTGSMEEFVQRAEREGLTDEAIVAAIVANSNLDEGAAREALAIMRDEIPFGTIV